MALVTKVQVLVSVSALRAALTSFSITVKIMQENKVLVVIIIN